MFGRAQILSVLPESSLFTGRCQENASNWPRPLPSNVLLCKGPTVQLFVACSTDRLLLKEPEIREMNIRKKLFLKNAIFWDGFVINRCFGETYRLHLQGRRNNMSEEKC
jgi:hypothetical protein